MSCKNNQIIQDRYETGTQNGMEVGSSLSHYISGKQSVGWSHSCLQRAGKSIGHTADIMQEFNLAWGSVRWVINPVKVLLPSTPLFRGWMGLWMGCSDLPGFSFRIQDFLPNTEARAAAADSGKSRVQVSSKWEIWETIEGAQWVAGWLAGRRLLWKYWKMLVLTNIRKMVSVGAGLTKIHFAAQHEMVTMRPWRWIAHSGLEVSCCPKLRDSCMLGFC